MLPSRHLPGERSAESVEFAAAGGVARAAQTFIGPNAPWLFVFHEFLGLTSYIREEAANWGEELGVNTLAIDLFDGTVGANREEGMALVAKVDPDRCLQIISGALDYVGRDRPVSMLGWCFGGGWALQAALLAGVQCRSTVMYYGMPVLDPNELARLAGPVIEIFGSRDKRINEDVRLRFESAMKEAGRELKTYVFEADHAFANPSNPQHDVDATAKAQEIALEFLRRTLNAA